MEDNMTLRLDPETGDIVFDTEGNLAVLYGDDTTAQNIRNALTAWKGDWPLGYEHGTDYKRILGKKSSELEPDEIGEVLREAIYQEDCVEQIDALEYERSGRALTASFDVTLSSGRRISVRKEDGG